MTVVEINPIKLSDAKDIFDIFADPKFYFWKHRPSSLVEQKARIKKQILLRKENNQRTYTIFWNKKIVGVIDIKIYQHRKYCGELGYIINTKFQGKGIATKAVSLIENDVVKKLGIKRIEILTRPKNIVSQKIALHNNYKKEGLLKKVFMMKDGSFEDAYLYAKTF